MESAWERMLDTVEQLADHPDHPIDTDVDARLAELATQAMSDGDIDGELHVPDVVRWLSVLALGHRAVRAARPGVDPESDLGNLRRIATRWLHPARPR